MVITYLMLLMVRVTAVERRMNSTVYLNRKVRLKTINDLIVSLNDASSLLNIKAQSTVHTMLVPSFCTASDVSGCIIKFCSRKGILIIEIF